jgi:hypothetical protein
MVQIPDFEPDGLLPAGDYEVTLDQLRRSILVSGGKNAASTWDAAWRGLLVDNLSVLVRQLWQVGIADIFIDGSFVEQKDHPNDIDGYFVCDLKEFATGRLERKLNQLDPDKVWTWDPHSRRPYRGFPKKQLPMWHSYRVELYPHYGQVSGMRDEYGHELEFPAAFRRSRRDGKPRGIVKIKKEATQ